MDGKLDTVREAIERLKGFTHHAASSQDTEDIKTVCAALSAINPDEIRQKFSYWLDELTKMVNRLYDTHMQMPSPDILGSLRIIDSQLRAAIANAEKDKSE